MARSHSSAPDDAISSLLAVTTDFLLAIAVVTISAATSVPPTSSAIMCRSGWETSWRQSLVFKTGPKASGIFFCSVCCEQTAFTRRRKAELEVDLFAIFSQNGHRSGTDVAQTNDAYVHLLHRWAMIASGFPRRGVATVPPRSGGKQRVRIARFRIASARGVKPEPALRQGSDRTSLPQWAGSLRHRRRNRCRRRG